MQYFLELFHTWQTSELLWAWLAFCTVTLLSIDVWQAIAASRSGGEHFSATAKGSLYWSLAWVGASFIFLLGATLIAHTHNPQNIPTGSLFSFSSLWITGYLVEKSLSVDNLFVFLVLFSSLGIAKAMQNTLLLYGILGAIVLRLSLILGAAYLISQYSWLLPLFGLFLLYLGFKIWPKTAQAEQTHTPTVVRKLAAWLPIDHQASGFWGFKDKKFYLTVPALALLSIAFVDLIFAVDSIPAIFAITTDTWIVASSNIFAVLGLRPLYFLLSHLKNQLILLPYALSIILTFIGLKLLISVWFHIPALLSLAFIVSVLALCAWMSIRKTKRMAS